MKGRGASWGESQLDSSIEAPRSHHQSSIITFILNNLFFFQGQWAPIYIATDKDNAKAVAALISHGADVNVRNEGRRTPLMNASEWGNLEIATMLMNAGADKELKHVSGWTATDFARKNNRKDVMELLNGR